MDKIIKPSMKVFEFGAGGSSIFFANKVQKIISVEHDKSWFTNVEVEIAKRKLTNWEGYCVEPVFLESDIGSTNIADPKQYLSGDLQYKNFSFKSYASYIEKYDDNFFDMVFVDGRSRPSCLMHSFNKVKKGGYLVLDNADIDYYLTHFNKDILNGSFKLIFDKYGAGPYSSLFWETVVWQKIY
ncbi:MAG: hypothetical protein MUE81_04640 [Thermoflexibacter sp.]|nr:hypothetical protein [Thermoflexibacter sp.]